MINNRSSSFISINFLLIATIIILVTWIVTYPFFEINFRVHYFPLILVIYLVLVLVYKIQGFKGYILTLGLNIVLFVLPLFIFWNSPSSTEFLIGGLLPWTDSSGYYWDASQLLEGNTLSSFSSRRPLFASFLAVLLGLTQQNLQLTLLLLILSNSVAAWLLAQELKKTYGSTIAAFILTLIFLFYTRFIGTTMTENLGLALGVLSLAILWRGMFSQNMNLCFFGIFVLTLGLNARAGAFFILPSLLLWGTSVFKGNNKLSLRFILLGFSAIFLGFVFNSVLLKLVGSPNAQSFSNFSYTLYGLLTGGNWTTVLTDYPELNNMTDIARSQRIYTLAFDILKKSPLSLVQGSLRAWEMYFQKSHSGLFGFINLPLFQPRLVRLGFRLLRLFSILGIIKCLLNYKTKPHVFILFSSLGIFLSVPFVPPWDADYMRAYATTIPYLLLVPAMGITLIENQIKRFFLISDAPKIYDIPKLLPIFTLSLISILLLGIITIKLFVDPILLTEISCTNNQETIYFRRTNGSHINIIEDESVPNNRLPDIQLSHFTGTLTPLVELYPQVTELLRKIPPNTTITNTLNLKNYQQVWLFIPYQAFPEETGIYGVCGQFNTQMLDKGYPFFQGNSIIKVSQ